MKNDGKYSGMEFSRDDVNPTLLHSRAMHPAADPASRQAFTLLETMIAASLFILVMTGIIEVFIMCNKSWHSTALNAQTGQMVNLAISKMVSGYGTNAGIRTASTVTLDTNYHGWPFTYKYWETNGTPPSADSTIHHICGCNNYDPKDGSWRLTLSNEFDGVKYIEYNARVRNIVWCPVTNLYGSYKRLTSAAEQKRVLICNYVSAARITNSAAGTVEIQLTVEKSDGMFIASNQASMFITKRN